MKGSTKPMLAFGYAKWKSDSGTATTTDSHFVIHRGQQRLARMQSLQGVSEEFPPAADVESIFDAALQLASDVEDARDAVGAPHELPLRCVVLPENTRPDRVVPAFLASYFRGNDSHDVNDFMTQLLDAPQPAPTGEDFHCVESAPSELTAPTEYTTPSGGRYIARTVGGLDDVPTVQRAIARGWTVGFCGEPGSGKALALDTPLATPSGWTTMGEIQVGDMLFGGDGRPARVAAATEVQYDRRCYEVEFSDGSVIVADAEHLWRTTTRAERLSRYRRTKGQPRWSVLAEPRELLAKLADDAKNEPDRTTTVAEVVEQVGRETRQTIYGVAKALPTAERRGKLRFVSRQRLLTEVAQHVNRPINSWRYNPHTPTKTTEELAQTVRVGSSSRANHAVACAQALVLPEADLLVPPYTLGAWLGDGNSSSSQITCCDPPILERIEDDGFTVTQTPSDQIRFSIAIPKEPVPQRSCPICQSTFTPVNREILTCGRTCGQQARRIKLAVPTPTCGHCGRRANGWTGLCRRCRDQRGTLGARLRTLGVLNNKHIPAQYLRSSESQRRALLAGLMDTDGTATTNGNLNFFSTSKTLANDVHELIVSLGYKASTARKSVSGRRVESSTLYTISFTTADCVFHLPRKRERQRFRERNGQRDRYIVDVRPVESVPVRCIQVANDDRMYLAGMSMIPTHNTTLAQVAAPNLVQHPFNGETTVEDVIGRFVPDPGAPSGFSWKDGPLLIAIRQNRPFLADELPRAPREVQALFLSVCDHRRAYIDLANPHIGELVAGDGFAVLITYNPGSGFGMDDALVDRIAFTITVPTDLDTAAELEVPLQLVSAARALQQKSKVAAAHGSEGVWVPSLRSLLKARDVATEFGLRFAAAALISACPDELLRPDISRALEKELKLGKGTLKPLTTGT